MAETPWAYFCRRKTGKHMNKFLLKAVFIISTFILFNSAAALAQTVKGVVRDSEPESRSQAW